MPPSVSAKAANRLRNHNIINSLIHNIINLWQTIRSRQRLQVVNISWKKTITFPIIRLGVIIGCISRKYFTFIISIFKVRPLPCRLWSWRGRFMFVTRCFGAFSKFAFGNLQDRFFNTSRCFVRNLKDFSSMLQALQEKNSRSVWWFIRHYLSSVLDVFYYSL